MFTNELYMGVVLRARVEKTVYGVETLVLLKEKNYAGNGQ